MTDPLRLPSTPRWVKLSGIVVGVLILLALVMTLLGGGRHGPWRHMPAEDAFGGQQPKAELQ